MFDDRAIKIKSIFHSQIRTIGTFSGVSLAIFGFSDRFPTLGTAMRGVSLLLMLYTAWFAVLADRQLVAYSRHLGPGPHTDALLQWRHFPLVVSFSVAAIAIGAAGRIVFASN